MKNEAACYMPESPRWDLVLLVVVCALVMSVATFGCSNVRAIGVAAGNINDHAAAIEKHAQAIAVEASLPAPQYGEIVAKASQIKSDASSIRSEVNAVTQNLGGVEDTESVWGKALLWLSIAAACCVIGFLLWRSGLDRAIYAIVSWLPVKTKTRAAANSDADALFAFEGNSDFNATAEDAVIELAARESIAKKRSNSKHYEAEFKAARKRQAVKSEPTPSIGRKEGSNA